MSGLSAQVSLVLLLVVGVAQAYERASVEGKPGTYLYWPQRAMTYRINAAGCADVPLDQSAGAIKRAFFSWASPSCTDVTFTFEGFEESSVTNLQLGDGEKPDFKNLIVWRETQWPPPAVTDPSITQDMPAVTTIKYDGETGVISDVDIDLNGFHFFWTTTDEPAKAATDIENIMSHEIGHFLGLEHSEDPEATMYAKTTQAEISKRTLERDDQSGVCFIYPFLGTTPKGPGQGTEKWDVKGGCALAGGGEPGHGGLLLLLFGLVILSRCRRVPR